MTEENKTLENKDVKDVDAPPHKKKAFFSKSKILVLVCTLFIASLIVGFQNCSREHVIGFSSSNPCTSKKGDTSDGARCTEIFIPGVSTVKTDILFIVDNSGSMGEEQQKISEKFDSFLAAVRNIDFQIGIITTDSVNSGGGNGGRLLNFNSNTRYLVPSTTNLENLFRSKVRTGTNGWGYEKPFLCAKKAIEQRDNHNKGFFRGGALLNLVIVTDEDEHDDTDRPNSANRDAFFAKFNEIYPNKTITVNAITGPCPTAYPADIIIDSVETTGGIRGSICANDYGSLLSDIGHSISSSISLTFAPIVETMKVTLDDGTELGPRDYNVNNKKVVITRSLKPGTKVTFNYEYRR